MERNLILIGMPAAGKTTVGGLLAARLGRDFLDTDALMEAREGRRLREIMAERGLEGFRAAEENTLLALRVRNTVVATGGSAVYSAPGMASLARQGQVVFLDCPLEVLAARVGDPRARGMVIAPGQTLAELYAERLPLYRRYAQFEIDCGDRTPDDVAEAVVRALV